MRISRSPSIVAWAVLLLVWALAWSSSARAELKYWYASSPANLATCPTATPNPTCGMSAEETWDNNVAIDATVNCWHTPSGWLGPTGGYYYKQSRGADNAGCDNLVKYLNAYRSNTQCDTADPEAWCYEAPPAPVCTAGTGWLTQVVTPDIGATISAFAGTCFNDCKIASAKQSSIGVDCDGTGSCSFVVYLKNEGGVCDAEPPASPAPTPIEEQVQEADPSDSGEVCRTSANGTEVCTSNQYGENCGYVNGEHVCLGKTDSDECWINDDGSRLCGTDAPMPPVPDSGVRGVKATPQDSVGAQGPSGAQNIYNYFNSATVAAASSPPGDDGANPNRSTSTNPRTSTTPVAEQGDGEGDGDSPAGDPPGEITGFEPCEGEACKSFEASLAAFYGALEAVPIVAAWTGIGSSIPAGACPNADITAFGESHSFTDTACGIWDDTVSPLLSLVFLFVWPFMGLRIVMSS